MLIYLISGDVDFDLLIIVVSASSTLWLFFPFFFFFPHLFLLVGG